MEGDGAGGGGGSGGAGPAPFLVKTYEMVDDPATDEIVSWSRTKKSFVVWNPPDFASQLLPTYFKHNNFSSFIRQLNTYGFRKIDPERWEFANEDFVQGKKNLLKNIHRRKPIHSHSNPPASAVPDAERVALEEEIERLNRDKADLQAALWKFKQQQSGTTIQLEDLERRLADMEQRQLKMIAFLQRASQNSRFMENLVKMASASSMDLSVIYKKRRLPPGLEPSENSFYDDHSSTSKPELGHVLDREFCDKLKLELCPAFQGSNLVTASTQNSNEESGSSQGKQTDCHGIMECLPLGPETLDLCDTGASICPTKNLLFPRAIDESDGLFPFHLSLTLASSAMQIDKTENSSRTPNSVDEVVATPTDPRTSNSPRENGLRPLDSANKKTTSLQEATPPSNDAPPVPTGRVNDVFWEQFLTERPGSSDAEEASSGLRGNPLDEQNEERKANPNVWRSRHDMEQLKL